MGVIPGNDFEYIQKHQQQFYKKVDDEITLQDYSNMKGKNLIHRIASQNKSKIMRIYSNGF